MVWIRKVLSFSRLRSRWVKLISVTVSPSMPAWLVWEVARFCEAIVIGPDVWEESCARARETFLLGLGIQEYQTR